MSSSTVIGAALEAAEQTLIALTPDEPAADRGVGPRARADAIYQAAAAQVAGLRLLAALYRRHPAQLVEGALGRAAAELREGRRP